nr:hypothetical protein [Pedobacter sp. ASV19]
MKSKQIMNFGFGKIMPPQKAHVIAYFIQKGRQEQESLAFYNYYSLKNWRNSTGEPIKNWKTLAWNWIWNNPFNQQFKPS